MRPGWGGRGLRTKLHPTRHHHPLGSLCGHLLCGWHDLILPDWHHLSVAGKVWGWRVRVEGQEESQSMGSWTLTAPLSVCQEEGHAVQQRSGSAGGTLMGLAKAAASYEMLILTVLHWCLLRCTYRHCGPAQSLLSFTSPSLGVVAGVGEGSCPEKISSSLCSGLTLGWYPCTWGRSPPTYPAGRPGDTQSTGHRSSLAS